MKFNRCFGCMEKTQTYPCPHCGFDPDQTTTLNYVLPFGTILAGQYVVGKKLGQGGFGITYIGFDLVLERKVAIKEYFPQGLVTRITATNTDVQWLNRVQTGQLREDGMRSVLREARKMAKIEDIAEVVRVLDCFQENETAYIVMDYVDGKTLMSKLEEQGPMSWEQAKTIFLPAISAMEKVHQAGMVHRDISPDNLMLTKKGVRILDLGAAKDLGINNGASSALVVKGGFSPLEQYTHQGSTGTWSDVYSLAATLYYTLTGVVPLSAVDRMEEDLLRWDLPELQRVPSSVIQAMKQAIALRIKDRTQTMARFWQQLQAAEPVRKLRRWLAPAICAALIAVLGTGLWIKSHSGKASGTNETVLAPVETGIVSVKETTLETENIAVEEEPLISSDVKTGEPLKFGAYDQDGFVTNGQEPIEWVVLKKEDGKALLLSTQAIDCLPYNDQYAGCTWATCSLRKWLNDTFYKEAFSDEEREWIVKTRVEAHANPEYSTNPGMNTDDYIFLLSVDEMEYYFRNDSDRMCSPTEYAVKQGAFRKEPLGTCWWWLRTPGETSRDASSINADGTIDTDDGRVNSDKGCVRPAMWVRVGNLHESISVEETTLETDPIITEPVEDTMQEVIAEIRASLPVVTYAMASSEKVYGYEDRNLTEKSSSYYFRPDKDEIVIIDITEDGSAMEVCYPSSISSSGFRILWFPAEDILSLTEVDVYCETAEREITTYKRQEKAYGRMDPGNNYTVLGTLDGGCRMVLYDINDIKLYGITVGYKMAFIDPEPD